MTSQNIHLPSVGVNCLVAGAYYYIKQKKFLPAVDWADKARRICPGPMQRFDQMALFRQAFQACKEKLGLAKAEALTWVYQQFNPFRISFGDQIRDDLIELIQEASADEQDSYYQEIRKSAALENVRITTLFSICEAFIAKFYSAEGGVDNTVGDALLLYEDLIHSRLKGSDQAIASVQYLTFLDSQGLQNCTFFESFRGGLGKTYKQSWLSWERHAIYQKWRG